jgi:hypothetical protein
VIGVFLFVLGVFLITAAAATGYGCRAASILAALVGWGYLILLVRIF